MLREREQVREKNSIENRVTIFFSSLSMYVNNYQGCVFSIFLLLFFLLCSCSFLYLFSTFVGNLAFFFSSLYSVFRCSFFRLQCLPMVKTIQKKKKLWVSFSLLTNVAVDIFNTLCTLYWCVWRAASFRSSLWTVCEFCEICGVFFSTRLPNSSILYRLFHFSCNFASFHAFSCSCSQ